LLNKKQIVDVMRGAPVWRPAADCHLWLWCTSNFLRDALWTMEVLGFEYKTNAVWSKMKHGRLQIGLGQYLRHAHELLLLGVRGQPRVPEPADRMPSVIIAPRARHSAKPVEAFELIERVSDGPRLEMFARDPRENWTVWGNEV
jgi:N6-adenosine-specific RNA methylase IME4